jgi:hypothetical protein
MMGKLGVAIIVVLVALVFFFIGIQYNNFTIRDKIEFCREQNMHFGYAIDINDEVKPVCNCYMDEEYWEHGLDGMGG